MLKLSVTLLLLLCCCGSHAEYVHNDVGYCGSCNSPGVWSDWYDRDDPAGNGDYETISSMAIKPCGQSAPLCVRYRIKDYRNFCRTDSPSDYCSFIGNQRLTVTPTFGLQCENDEQQQLPGESSLCGCCDYEVSYLCCFNCS